ncbi:MAG: alpha/beta hydrolase [Pseudomonadota bacterium]
MQLIFVHGSGGCKESWKYQTRFFPGSVAIDLPGHPEGDLCAAIEGYVAWLHSHIHAQGYKDVVLVGHSLGGGIALQYALDHATDLWGIVLVGSGARLRVHPMFLEALEKIIETPGAGEDIFAGTYDLIDPELAAVIRRRAAENGPASFLNDLKACNRFDVMGRLGEITVPILAIAGDRDVMTPPKYAQFLADKIPGTRVAVIPGGTHMVFAEKPAEVNRAIGDFITGLTARGMKSPTARRLGPA